MAEEEKRPVTEEIARLVKEQIEEEVKRKRGRRPAPPPKLEPKKEIIDLYCERSFTNFPIGKSSFRGWLYICDLNCKDEDIVESLYADTVYCSSAESFYANVATVLARGKPVTFDRDYFAVRLPMGKEKSVKKCVVEGVDCEKDHWLLVVRPTPRAIIFFTTSQTQLEELFNIRVKSPFMAIRGVDVVSHAIVESLKETQTLLRDVLPMMDLTERRPGAISRANKTYAAVMEALAQIISSCMAFGSEFVRRNMRFMTCGNFVPIPYLLIILDHLKRCKERRDMVCAEMWIEELDKLIDAYRHPGPPYVPFTEEKDIFRFRGFFT